jgi:hypothetical protein
MRRFSCEMIVTFAAAIMSGNRYLLSFAAAVMSGVRYQFGIRLSYSWAFTVEIQLGIQFGIQFWHSVAALRSGPHSSIQFGHSVAALSWAFSLCIDCGDSNGHSVAAFSWTFSLGTQLRH